jgi:hypothetical protein
LRILSWWKICGIDEVKGTDNLNYVIYEASAHDKKITVAESGKYKERGRGESKEKDKSGMPKWADSLSYNGRDQVVYPIYLPP